MGPVGYIGSESGRTRSASEKAFTSRRFSATVRPVTVRRPPWSSLASSRSFMTAGMPPPRFRSDIT